MWHIYNVTFDVDHCNIHHGLSHILMFIMVMFHSDIYYGLCCTMLFIKGYIALWYPSMVHSLMALSHCNIHWCLCRISRFTFHIHWCDSCMFRKFLYILCRIVLFIKVYISLRRYQGLYHITTLSRCYSVLLVYVNTTKDVTH